MPLEQIEYLHTIGKMPDKYYYAQNRKNPEYNLNEQHQRMYQRTREKQEEICLTKTVENDLHKQIEKELKKEFQKIFSKR